MISTSTCHLPVKPGHDDRELWYVPHARIRTRAAAERAVAITDWITSEHRTEVRPDEQALFLSLHTCAFRARRKRRSPLIGGDWRHWIRRWHLIREYIVAENLGLAYTMISRFRAKDFDHDDLLSEAMFALARAVDRFNPWRGFRFSTYACNVIARALMRRGKVQMRYRRFFPVQCEGTYDHLDSTGPLDSPSGVYLERLRRAVACNLGGLTEIESKVLSQRFPTDRESPLTFRQIGKAVGLSKERVRQIQHAALVKLRDVLRRDPLLA